MEFIKNESVKVLSNPGCESYQLLNPANSESERITITEVHLSAGESQPRHKHESSEQVWYAIKGSGKLLLADEEEKDFNAGDVVRFVDGEIHGLLNNSNKEFIYISVTAPPINFNYAYKNEK